MLDSIKNLGNWIEQKTKTYGGWFVLGLLFGALIPTISFFNERSYSERILTEKESAESNEDKWQERAFNAEKNCLSKVKEMSRDLELIRSGFDAVERTTRIQAEQSEKDIEVLEGLAEDLKKLQK